MRRVVGPRQLQAHQRREHAAEQEEGERGDEIAPADRLVIDVREPADEPARIRPRALEHVRIVAGVRKLAVARHRSVSRYATSACRSSAGQRIRRHLIARLDRLRIADPRRRGVRACSAACRRRACCGWRGASDRARPARRPSVPRIVWQPAHRAAHEDVAARVARRLVRRIAAGCRMASSQRFEVALRTRRRRRTPCARAAGRRTPRTGRGRCRRDRPASRSPSCSRGSDRACLAGSAPRSCGSRRATSP